MATVFVFNNVSGGDWNTSANWTPNGVPSAGDTAQITSGGTYTVSTTQNETIAILDTAKSVTLAIGSHTTFDVTSGTGAGVNAGAITVANGATLELGGRFVNSGSIALNATASNTALQIDGGALTLSGPGTVAMTDDSLNAIATTGSPVLSNAGNTISGAGTIGSLGLTLFNGGKIVGNGAANELFLILNNGFNSGTLEGTTSQGLLISATQLNQTANGVVLASGSGARVHLGDSTIISGGMIKTVGSGAAIDVAAGAEGFLQDLTISSGSVVEVDGGAIGLGLLGTIVNSGTISVGAGAVLAVGSPPFAATLTGGGKVALADGQVTGDPSAPPLTNLNNTIHGFGNFGVFGASVTLINKGTVNADAGSPIAFNLGSVTNSGTMEATSTGGLVFRVATTNAKTIEALGTNTLVVISSTVTNTSTGLTLASGNGAHVDLQGGTIAGGTLQTIGAGAMIDVVSGTNGTLDGSSAGHPLTNKALFVVSAGATANIVGTIVNSNTISVGANGSGGVLRVALGGASLQGNGKVILSDFGSGSIQMITSSGTGGTLSNVNNTITGAGTIGGGQLALVNSGTINANTAAALTIDTGVNTIFNTGLMETTAAGGLDIKSDVSNGGTLAASAGLLKLEGNVTGSGTTVIAGGGSVEIAAANGTEKVRFALGATGRLILDQSVSFGGTVSGFGAGGNHIEAIDFADISSAGAHFTYSAAAGNTSGTLTVINGATSGSVVLIGAYTSGNFTLGNDGNGHVLITDPPVVAQKPGNAAARIADGTVLEVDVADSGKVTFGGTNGTLLLDDASLFTGAVAGFRGLDRIDLAQIGFGTETTLGYSANAAGTGGTLRVSDGVHAASIALLGNYMAASFATAADGHGGTLITEADQAAHAPLASPRHA